MASVAKWTLAGRKTLSLIMQDHTIGIALCESSFTVHTWDKYEQYSLYVKVLAIKLGKLPINSFMRQLAPMTLMFRHKQARTRHGCSKIMGYSLCGMVEYTFVIQRCTHTFYLR
jgi:hypothetical protein